MRVSKLSPFQTFFYSGILSCTIAGIAYATTAQATPKAQMYAVGQASGGTIKTYKSQLGFRLDFKAPYTLDTSQEGKGILVLRNPALGPEAVGSDEPTPVNSNVQSQSSPGDKITIVSFDNPQRLMGRTK